MFLSLIVSTFNIRPFLEARHCNLQPYRTTDKILVIYILIYIFIVVLYVCETWSITLREEDILRVFENRVLRRIFGPKSDEVTEGWRKLHNEELHGLYSSPCIVRVIKTRRMKWAGHVVRMGEVRVNTTILLGGLKGGDH
jgi:hypothetical protein